MVGAVFDTCILIDFLNGIPAARDELSLYKRRAISVVTWMEVMIGATPENEQATNLFLRGFEIVPLNDDIAWRAVAARKRQRMKLPDAIIMATAEQLSMLFVTRNPKDFHGDAPGLRIPYKL